MPGNTLHWTTLNINGKIIRRTSDASLRCQWKGSGCHVTIKADNMPDIVLHVELDVTEMSYTPGNPRGDELACIIFKVSLNRPAVWARNGTQTWRGHIGVTFDCTLQVWHIKTYRALIKSLASCFVGKTISEKTPQEIEDIWNGLINPPPIVIRGGRILPFHDMTYEALYRLSPGEWLNDDIITTGLRDWCLNSLLDGKPIRDSILLMNPYFFKKLKDQGLPSLSRWLPNVNVFMYQYIVIPVHWHNNHWILAIIINPSGIHHPQTGDILIAIFDSLACKEATDNISALLKRWLCHKAKKPLDGVGNCVTIQAQVPHQENGFDCGIYVIHFFKTFFSDAEAFTTHIQRKLKRRQILEIWKEDHIDSVRKDLLRFIQFTALAHAV